MNKIAYQPFLFILHHLNVKIHAIKDILEKVTLYQFYEHFDSLLQQANLTQERKNLIKEQLQQSSKMFKQWEIVEKWLTNPKHHIVLYSDNTFPKWLKNIEDCPLMLYIKGSNLDLLSSIQIAIVGSRKKTTYGTQVTAKFASEIVANNLTITSGLAYGIDSIAHKNALLNDGLTIAVLGSGLENIYPQENITLANEILAKQGLLVSEFFLDAKPLKHHFPIRNRIISGLSRIILITEGTVTSGSLITARHALEQNRCVLAVPGSIFSAQSKGCHQLINQGAKLAHDIHHILEELNPMDIKFLNQYNNKSKLTTIEASNLQIQDVINTLNSKPRELSSANLSIKSEFNLDEQYNDINQNELNVLKHIDFTKTHLNNIAQNTKLDLADLSEILILLEFKGYIVNQHGSFKRLK